MWRREKKLVFVLLFLSSSLGERPLKWRINDAEIVLVASSQKMYRSQVQRDLGGYWRAKLVRMTSTGNAPDAINCTAGALLNELDQGWELE